MSYIQCKDAAEAEKIFGEKKAGFLSPDNRIYDTITMADQWATWELKASTIIELERLQSECEMASDGRSEMSFLDLEERARELREQFEKTMKAIGQFPIKKRERQTT